MTDDAQDLNGPAHFLSGGSSAASGAGAVGGGWMPMETAPKDGTVCLLFVDDICRMGVDGPPITLGYWGVADSFFDCKNQWVSVEAIEEQWGMGGEMTGPLIAVEQMQVTPTHWMPLPEPPEVP